MHKGRDGGTEEQLPVVLVTSCQEAALCNTPSHVL